MARPLQDRSLLEAALKGLEVQREELDTQIAHVRDMLGKRGRGRPKKEAESSTTTNTESSRGRRRPLSAAARKRIAAAQKKRWAEYRKTAAAS